MGEHQATARRRPGRLLAVGLLTAGVCLSVSGGAPVTPPDPPAERIAGLAGLSPAPAGPSWAPAPVARGRLRSVATAGDGAFTLHTGSGPRRFLPGVNLGATTPGHQPGELAIAATDYRAWFGAMRRLGVRAVRVYTIHPPAFYEELAAHNRSDPDRPLYLVQGVYLPDESYVTGGNLYDRQVTDAFVAELHDASAAVSGDLTRPRRPGRAGGTWGTDVSDWLAAWVIGVEWDPSAVAATDRRNARAPGAAGRYFRSTLAASPTERWLAARMDELATDEARRGRTVPIAFTNWPTTDPLAHPDEPIAGEDLVGVDANHVRPTPAWPGGTFASYHAYPYYPDFQRHEPRLQRYRYAGRADPYAGYLDSLRRHHRDLPVLVTEFGVPSSLGSAHHGPLGRSQGDHGEAGAMRIDAELLHLIRDTGMAGGFLFNWTDEWFKFTWNTIRHQVPGERRQLWHDPLTNEQHFGVLATDATGAPDAAPVGLLDDPGGRPATRVTGRVDESYLHLRVTLADPAAAGVTIGLDVLPAVTGPAAPGSADTGADVALTLDLAGRTGRAWIRAALDPLDLDDRVPAAARPSAPAGWRAAQLLLNRDLTVPTTGRRLPAELLDVGALRYGRWDPQAPDADSRALWRRDGSDLVLRIPWAMAGFADPSSHQVLVPRPLARPDPGGAPAAATAGTASTSGVTVVVSAGGRDQRSTELRWERWQRVYYRERLKQGAGALRDAFVTLGR